MEIYFHVIVNKILKNDYMTYVVSKNLEECIFMDTFLNGDVFLDNNEFNEYIKNGMQNLLSDVGKYQIDYNKVSSIINNEFTKKMKRCADEFGAKIEEWAAVIKNMNFSIPISEELREYARIAEEAENLTEEEFEKRFQEEYKQSRELGEYGWIPSEHCNPKEINMWYHYIHSSPKKILDFFEEDNCRVLYDIRNTLSGYYSERPYVLYYQNGIVAFDRGEYMTVAMYWTILLENRVANLVDFPEKVNGKRPTYAVKYSDKGFEIQKDKTYNNADDFTKKRFLFLNVYPALIAYLHRLFAFGNLPLDLNKETEAEPDYLDRTWLLHGRCCRDTTKWDCIQLLNALDVCEFALKDAENIIETDIEKTEKSLTE